jgi:hypothetical protein
MWRIAAGKEAGEELEKKLAEAEDQCEMLQNKVSTLEHEVGSEQSRAVLADSLAKTRQKELEHVQSVAVTGGVRSVNGLATYTVSTLRALNNDLGVRAPVGLWDPTGFIADGSVENLKLRRQAELTHAHGRLAMMAVLSSLLQDGLTESALGAWATYAASPPRALAKDLGGQAPVDSWDPTDFNEKGRAENLKRRRQAEFKHGRIAMLAMRGHITKKRSAAELAFRRLAKMTTSSTFSQNDLTGSAWGMRATFTASPLRTHDKDISGRAPVGSRDPTCFTTNGNVENVNLHRRADGSSESAGGDRDSFPASPLRTFKSKPSGQATAGVWEESQGCNPWGCE